MAPLSYLLKLADGYKTYSAAIALVIGGLGAIATKDYTNGLHELFQGLQAIAAGGTVAAVRQAIAKNGIGA